MGSIVSGSRVETEGLGVGGLKVLKHLCVLPCRCLVWLCLPALCLWPCWGVSSPWGSESYFPGEGGDAVCCSA